MVMAIGSPDARHQDLLDALGDFSILTATGCAVPIQQVSQDGVRGRRRTSSLTAQGLLAFFATQFRCSEHQLQGQWVGTLRLRNHRGACL